MKQLLYGLLTLFGIRSENRSVLPVHPTGQLSSEILRLQPADIGISRDNTVGELYAFMMETGLSDGDVQTLVVLADGTAGLYYGNCSSITNDGQNDRVQRAAENLFMGANHFLEHAEPSSEILRPGEGSVTFTFLTFNTVMVYRASEKALSDDRDKLSGLYFLAHKLMSELRRA